MKYRCVYGHSIYELFRNASHDMYAIGFTKEIVEIGFRRMCVPMHLQCVRMLINQ